MRKSLTLSLAGILSCALSAQSGSFQTSGMACQGSGNSNGCYGNNTSGGTHRSLHNANTFALPFTTGNTPSVTLGFELFTGANSTTPVIINGYLMDADSAGAPNKVLAQNKIVILQQVGFYRCSFPTPQVLPPNTKYFVTWDPAQNQMQFPFLSSGTNGTHYWHPPSSATWNGPFNSVAWSWRVICAGGGSAPVIGNTGLPAVGKTFNVDLSGARPQSATLYAIGASAKQWGPVPLPFKLDALGAPGCTLYCSLDFLGGFATDANGKLSVPLPVPNDSRLLNLVFQNQFLVFDQPANSLGIVSTGLGTATVGK